MNAFIKIELKLKCLLGPEQNLASAFEVDENIYRVWKYRESIPYKNIVFIAKKYNLDLNYIFFSKKGGKYCGFIENN